MRASDRYKDANTEPANQLVIAGQSVMDDELSLFQASLELQPGSELNGRYTVLEVLGRGGMGCVYCVWDEEAGVERALKILTSYKKPKDGVDALSKEFLAMCQFRHPNIVAVHDLGYTERGMPFFTMDYIPGETLLSYICHTNKEWLHNLCREIMLALAAIHSQGMLHADLKPANILINRGKSGRPQARLADFGLAAKITEFSTQHILGTVPYLAPERILRRPPDIRTDLYALGVLLYYVLSGELPFGAEPTQEVLEHHLHTQPKPPSKVEPSIPPLWDEVILRLLSKDPDMRYGSVDEVLEVWNGCIKAFSPTSANAFFHCEKSIGREHESELFRHLLLTSQCEGNLLLLTGEVGCGKTHLLNNWRIETQLQKGHWIQSEPKEDGSFYPFSELFGTLATRVPEAIGVETLATYLDSAEVRMMAKDIDALSGKILPLIRGIRLFSSVVFVIDQADLLEKEALQLFRLLFVQCLDLPILWIVSGCRIDNGFFPNPDEVSNRVNHIALKPLHSEDIHRLLNHILGKVNGLQSLCEYAEERSEGNPARLMKLLEELQSSGSLHSAHGAWWFDLAVARYVRAMESGESERSRIKQGVTSDDDAPLLQAREQYQLGRKANRQGKFTDALSLFREAEHWALKSITNDKLPLFWAHLWRSMGWSYMMQGQYALAQQACERALEEISSETDHILCSRIHRLYAAVAFYQGQSTLVQRAAKQALALAQEYNDLRGQAEAHFAFGNFANLEGKYRDAIRSFKLAYQYFSQIEKLEAMGRCRNNLGVASYLLGDWPQAIYHWEHFASICKQLNARVQQVNALNNFAFLYKDRGLFQQAKRTFLQALEIAKEDQLERLEATLCGNLGEVLWRMGELEEARSCIQRAIFLAEKLEAEHERVENCRRLIMMDLESRDFWKVEGGLLKLLHTLQEKPLPKEEAQLLQLWGRLWLDRAMPNDACLFLEQAEERFRSLKATFEQAQCWTLLARAYLASGAFRTARQFADKAREHFQTLGASWELEQLLLYFPKARTNSSPVKTTQKVNPKRYSPRLKARKQLATAKV